MPNPSFTSPKPAYDPRWFIWCIVFLVVVGVGLTAYIVLSDNGTSDFSAVITAHAADHRASSR